MSEFKPILLTLPSFTPSLAVEVLPYGLTIHRIYVQVDGRTHDIVIGPEDPKDHVKQKYTNTIVGRYANRIPTRTHSLERHGISSQFTPLANENEYVSLHGGPVGYDSKVWKQIGEDDPSLLFSSAELSHLAVPSASSQAIFRLVSEDGDQGYPGKIIVEALVALIGPGGEDRISGDEFQGEHDIGSILLVYRAKIDEGEKKIVTPVNLTQHWGFNLDASMKDVPNNLSVENHTLTIKADRIVVRDKHSLSTGSFLSVSELPAHAHNSKKIGDRIPDTGYDDYYAFSASALSTIPTRIPLSGFNPDFDLLKELVRPASEQVKEGRGTRPEPLVELSSEISGLKLLFNSNQHGLMFYSNVLATPSSGARKKIHGGSGISGHGDAYGPSTAAFLEFHDPLTAFIDPKNRDGEDTLLTSEELYHNYVRCDVRFKALGQ